MEDLNIDQKYAYSWQKAYEACQTKDWKALCSAFWSLNNLRKSYERSKKLPVIKA